MRKIKGRVKGYASEATFTRKKRNVPTQAFEEACVLFDVKKDFCVVACRGEGLRWGCCLREVLLLGEEELDFLRDGATVTPISLVCGQKDTWMIFSALYKATGLLLGIRVTAERDALCRVILKDRFISVVLSPEARRVAIGGGERKPLSAGLQIETVCAISAILRNLSNDGRVKLSQRVEWLARFAGYPVVQGATASRLAVSDELSPKLTAYLLCLFLALRGQGGGRLIPKGAAEAQIDKGLILEWQEDGARAEGTEIDPMMFAEDPMLSFLARDCFRCFRLICTPRGFCLAIRVTPTTYRLRGYTEQRTVTLLISGATRRWG